MKTREGKCQGHGRPARGEGKRKSVYLREENSTGWLAVFLSCWQVRVPGCKQKQTTEKSASQISVFKLSDVSNASINLTGYHPPPRADCRATNFFRQNPRPGDSFSVQISGPRVGKTKQNPHPRA